MIDFFDEFAARLVLGLFLALAANRALPRSMESSKDSKVLKIDITFCDWCM